MKYAIKYTPRENWYVDKIYRDGSWHFGPFADAILYDTMGNAIQAIADRARKPGWVSGDTDMKDVVFVGVIEEAPPPPVLTRKEVLL